MDMIGQDWKLRNNVMKFLSSNVPLDEDGWWTNVEMFATTSLHGADQFILILQSIQCCRCPMDSMEKSDVVIVIVVAAFVNEF